MENSLRVPTTSGAPIYVQAPALPSPPRTTPVFPTQISSVSASQASLEPWSSFQPYWQHGGGTTHLQYVPQDQRPWYLLPDEAAINFPLTESSTVTQAPHTVSVPRANAYENLPLLTHNARQRARAQAHRSAIVDPLENIAPLLLLASRKLPVNVVITREVVNVNGQTEWETYRENGGDHVPQPGEIHIALQLQRMPGASHHASDQYSYLDREGQRVFVPAGGGGIYHAVAGGLRQYFQSGYSAAYLQGIASNAFTAGQADWLTVLERNALTQAAQEIRRKPDERLGRIEETYLAADVSASQRRNWHASLLPAGFPPASQVAPSADGIHCQQQIRQDAPSYPEHVASRDLPRRDETQPLYAQLHRQRGPEQRQSWTYATCRDTDDAAADTHAAFSFAQGNRHLRTTRPHPYRQRWRNAPRPSVIHQPAVDAIDGDLSRHVDGQRSAFPVQPLQDMFSDRY